MGWRDTGQPQGTPPPGAAGPGPDHTLSRRPAPPPEGNADVSDTMSFAYTTPQHSAPPPDRDDRRAPHTGQHVDAGQATRADQAPDVKRTAPAAQLIGDSFARAMSTVRRSIPLRTVLFLLPPLVLPALAFDLSVVATLLVALTLLWLAAAAGLFSTMMLEGSQHLSVRFSQDRLERISRSGAGDDDALQDALLAVGAQLDILSDQIATLSQSNRPADPPDDPPERMSHRPQEHWPNSPRDEQYDRYGQTAVPDTNWSESRWRR